MMNHAIIIYIVCVTIHTARFPVSASIISDLFTLISDDQVKNGTEFRLFPPAWEMQKGIYKNEVKLNFHGSEQYSLIRDLFKVPDNNMFSPAWVTSCLLDAYGYGKGPKPTTAQVEMALGAVNTFRNLNEPGPNLQMTFWKQKFNKTAQYYQSFPGNLFELLKFPDYLPDKMIEEILEKLGLKDLAHILQLLIQEKDIFALAFHIPPDFDDTFVNIGLGGLLAAFQQDFSEESSLWKQQNQNLSSVFGSLKRYAYRPFSKSTAQSTIDTRTYFYLRSFLEMANSTGQDVALITTWLQDTDEVKALFSKGVAMPFNVNNVDITVSANFIYGMIMCMSTDLCSPDDIDEDVQKIFLNTTALIIHEIQQNLSSRPDLALTYYPSKYEFYWFVSRSYAWLHRFCFHQDARIKCIANEIMAYAYKGFGDVLMKEMTKDVLTDVKMDGNESMYIDNFLGDNDIGLFNESIQRAEDRIFSTAMTANALINTWTFWHNGSLLWEDYTPGTVKDAVQRLVTWLEKNSLSGAFKPWNTFFSGSSKGVQSMPFFYPANRREYFNGTTFPDDKFPTDFRNIIGVQGIVSAAEYDAMLKLPHFGRMTPMIFEGYNSEPGEFFPFWSCDAYTYATTLVALSTFDNIANKS